MDYLKAVARSCIPIIGLAVIAALYEEPRLFWDVLLLPLAVGLPLIMWLSIKIGSQAATKQLIRTKHIILYGLSLIAIAAVVCFCFVLEGIGSHGSHSAPFLTKCLFAFTIIVAIPLVDLILYRSSQLSHAERNQGIKYATILSRVIFLAVAVFLFIQIIQPPLNMALRLQHRNIARTLIALGADVHKKDGYGCTPLWYALHRCDPEMAVILLNRGAELDKRQASWCVLEAIRTNNIDMLRLLLSRGVDANSTDMGRSPLAYACQLKRMTIVRILLDSGADINIPHDGKSALDIAREVGDAPLVKLLLQHGKRR